MISEQEPTVIHIECINPTGVFPVGISEIGEFFEGCIYTDDKIDPDSEQIVPCPDDLSGDPSAPFWSTPIDSLIERFSYLQIMRMPVGTPSPLSTPALPEVVSEKKRYKWFTGTNPAHERKYIIASSKDEAEEVYLKSIGVPAYNIVPGPEW